MQEERNYLSDEELEKLITEMEQEPLVQAPEYLEKMILQKAERIAVRESVEIVPIRHAMKERRKPIPQEPSKRGQLVSYSLKIAAAAAAAIALVIMVPEMESRTADSYRQEQYMQEQKKQEEQGESGKMDRENKSVTHNLNEKTSDFCSRLFEKTNEILFQREEK